MAAELATRAIPLDGLRAWRTDAFRMCVKDGNEVHSSFGRVSVFFEASGDANYQLPVALLERASGQVARGSLTLESQRLTLDLYRLEAAVAGSREGVRCSSWLTVALGPLTGNPGSGSLRWIPRGSVDFRTIGLNFGQDFDVWMEEPDDP